MYVQGKGPLNWGENISYNQIPKESPKSQEIQKITLQTKKIKFSTPYKTKAIEASPAYSAGQTLAKYKITRIISDLVLYIFGKIRIKVGNEYHRVKLKDVSENLALSNSTILNAIIHGTVTETLQGRISNMNATKNFKTEELDDVEDITKDKNISGEMNKEAERTAWANMIIEKYGLDKPGNHTNTKINLKFSSEEAAYYETLQTEIKNKILLEWDRPTITSYFYDGDPEKITHTIGMLGGMGPVSDSIMAKGMVEDLPANTMLVVYSAPAPFRPSEKSCSKLNIAQVPEWAKGVDEFLGKYDPIIMGTNTGHTHLNKKRHIVPKWVPIAGPLLNAFKLNRYKEKFLHIPNMIATGFAAYAKENPGNPLTILTAGTKEAFEDGVYSKALTQAFATDKLELNYKDLMTAAKDSIPGKYNDVEAASKDIQIYINAAKQGTLTGPQAEMFVDILDSVIKREKPTHLVLSCTELPQILNIWKEHQKKTDLPWKNDCVVVDTEEIIILQGKAALKNPEFEKIKDECKNGKVMKEWLNLKNAVDHGKSPQGINTE